MKKTKVSIKYHTRPVKNRKKRIYILKVQKNLLEIFFHYLKKKIKSQIQF